LIDNRRHLLRQTLGRILNDPVPRRRFRRGQAAVHLDCPNDRPRRQHAQSFGQGQHLRQAEIMAARGRRRYFDGKIGPSPAMDSPWAVVGKTGIDHVQHGDIGEPIEQVCRRDRATYANRRTGQFGNSLGHAPAQGVVAMMAADANNKYFAGHQARSIVSLRKWVEQLIQGS
jgi:hypothetical protein